MAYGLDAQTRFTNSGFLSIFEQYPWINDAASILHTQIMDEFKKHDVIKKAADLMIENVIKECTQLNNEMNFISRMLWLRRRKPDRQGQPENNNNQGKGKKNK